MGETNEAPNGVDSTAPTVKTSLVGREREREQLRQQLAELFDGYGRLICVNGEAGVGKTALTGELAIEARRRGALVLSGACYDLAITPPYGPFIDVSALTKITAICRRFIHQQTNLRPLQVRPARNCSNRFKHGLRNERCRSRSC